MGAKKVFEKCAYKAASEFSKLKGNGVVSEDEWNVFLSLANAATTADVVVDAPGKLAEDVDIPAKIPLEVAWRLYGWTLGYQGKVFCERRDKEKLGIPSLSGERFKFVIEKAELPFSSSSLALRSFDYYLSLEDNDPRNACYDCFHKLFELLGCPLSDAGRDPSRYIPRNMLSFFLYEAGVEVFDGTFFAGRSNKKSQSLFSSPGAQGSGSGDSSSGCLVFFLVVAGVLACTLAGAALFVPSVT